MIEAELELKPMPRQLIVARQDNRLCFFGLVKKLMKSDNFCMEASFSAIVPVHNVFDALLHPCIDALSAQTYPSLEILLIIDDPRWNQFPFVNDGKFRHIFVPPCGPGDARNAGIAISKSDYVVFVDADDTIEPDYIERLAKDARGMPDIIRMRSRKQTIDQPSHPIHLHHDNLLEYFWLYPAEESIACANISQPVLVRGMAYRTKFIIENGIRFPGEKMLGEDHIFNLRCSVFATKCLIDCSKIGYHYAENRNSLMHNLTFSTAKLDYYFILIVELCEAFSALPDRIARRIPLHIISDSFRRFDELTKSYHQKKKGVAFVAQVFEKTGFFEKAFSKRFFQKKLAKNHMEYAAFYLSRGDYSHAALIFDKWHRRELLFRCFLAIKRFFVKQDFWNSSCPEAATKVT